MAMLRRLCNLDYPPYESIDDPAPRALRPAVWRVGVVLGALLDGR